MAGFANAWSDCLPQNHRDALYSALTILSDEFFEYDLDDKDHVFRKSLPEKYLPKYTALFLRNFYYTFLTAGYKLSLPIAANTLIACTAEELSFIYSDR